MNKDKHTENHYRKLCEKLNEEIYLLEQIIKKKIQNLKNKKKGKMDPVGKEDADVDNDGKKNTKSDRYIKARREKIGQEMKKKKMVNEGYTVTDGNLFYGGFPRIVNEENGGEEGSWEKFMDLVNKGQRGYFDNLPGERGKKRMPKHIDGLLTIFTNDPSEKGDNVLDDLIQAGFPAETMGAAARIRKASILSQRRSAGKADPTLRGTYKPAGRNSSALD